MHLVFEVRKLIRLYYASMSARHSLNWVVCKRRFKIQLGGSKFKVLLVRYKSEYLYIILENNIYFNFDLLKFVCIILTGNSVVANNIYTSLCIRIL